jgi:hypothetical protein
MSQLPNTTSPLFSQTSLRSWRANFKAQQSSNNGSTTSDAEAIPVRLRVPHRKRRTQTRQATD